MNEDKTVYCPPGRIGVPRNLVGPDGVSMKELTRAVVSKSNLDPASESWESYLAWRRTKCRAFDRERLMGVFKNTPDTSKPDRLAEDANNRMIEEIDQATLEFVGELAEIGELCLENDANQLFRGECRGKLIDECGDAIFCGCWALDAWGQNPLLEIDPEFGVELLQVEEGHAFDFIRRTMSGNLPIDRFSPSDLEELIVSACTLVVCEVVKAQTLAGLTANAFKKVKYQRRDQDHELQCARVVTAMEHVNSLLIMANSSMAEAMAANRKKLDARFPDGYKPGVGGGIREGDGK